MRDESRNVRAEEHFVFAHSDNQRSGATSSDDAIRVVCMSKQQRESTLEAVEHGQRRGLEITSGRSAVGTVQGTCEHVRGDLGVGFGLQLNAGILQLLT